MLACAEKQLTTDGPLQPSYQVHRVDLHNELRRLATEPDGSGQPCQLHLATPVKACDAIGGTIALSSGEHIKADVIIATDGIQVRYHRKCFRIEAALLTTPQVYS